LSNTELTKGEKIEVEVTITNTGAMDGAEVVQLYTLDKVRSITPPEKELKGFQKIYLKAGESKRVVFTLTEEMLRFYNASLQYVSEPGEFTVMVGGNSKDVFSKDIVLK
jgi:beta-glucosidase